MNEDFLTKKRYKELEVELADLTQNKRKEIASLLEYARSLGDLSENAEYHAAREEQAKVEDRISQIEQILKNAKIIKLHHSNSVEVGTTVTVKKDKEKDSRDFQIVGSEEADMVSGKISHTSPLGSAMLGKKKGDTVEIEAPSGKVVYKIVSIK